MTEQAFFRFGTNVSQVASEVTRELNRISQAVQQARGAMGGSGAEMQFLQGFEREVARASQQAQQSIQRLGQEFRQSMQQAQAEGRTWQRPTAGSFAAEGRQIGVEFSRELKDISERHLAAIPEGMDPESFRQVASQGSRAMLEQFQGIYDEQAAQVNRVMQETTRRTQPVARQLQIPIEGTAREIAQTQARIGTDAAVQQAQELEQRVASAGGDPAAQRAVLNKMRTAQRSLSAMLAEEIESNVDEAGRVLDLHGTQRLPGGIIHREGRFFREQRVEGVRQAQELRPERDHLEIQQARQRLSERLHQQAETVQQQTEASWRMHSTQTDAERLRSEEDRAWAEHARARRGQERQQTQERRQLERQAVQVQRQRIDRERQRQAEEENAHRQRLARALARRADMGRDAMWLPGGARVATGVEDPQTALVHRIDQQGRAHELAGNELRQGRIALAAQQEKLRRETERHARAQQEAAQQLRREAARRMRGIPGGGRRPPGGGMGGPVTSGGGGMFGGDGIFTEEGIFGHGQRYARYTLVATAIFALQAAIRDTWQEAQHLAEATTDLEVAMGRGAEVSQSWHNELQDIARIAGTNVAQAMEVAARGVRAFSDSLTESEEAAQSTGTAVARAAERLAIIADKDIASATGDIIAIGTSFEMGADGLDRINEAIANAKRLGGFPAEVAQGAANAAQAFAEAGFSLEETASTLGVVQARLDQTGQTTATRLARVFQTARGGPAQASMAAVGIDTGRPIREQIDELARLISQGELAERQVNDLVNAVAGTFASREFLAMLQNWNDVQDNVAQSILSGGRATDEFNRRLNNLAGLLRRIRGALAGIQTGLIEANFFAPIGLLLNVLEPTLRSLNQLLNLFNQLPEGLRTGIVLLGQYAAAMRGIARMNAARMIERGPEAALVGQRIMPAGWVEAQRRRAMQTAMRREPEAARVAGLTRETAARQQATAAITRENAARTRNAQVMTTQQAHQERMNLQSQATRRHTEAQTAATTRLTHALRAQIAVLAQRATALRTQVAERGLLATGVGGARRGAAGARGAVGAVAGSTIGRMAGVFGLITAAMEVVDSFQSVRQAGDSAASALQAVREATTETEFQEAAQQFSTAASEFGDASSGFSGMVQSFLRQMAGMETDPQGLLPRMGSLLGRMTPWGMDIPGVDAPSLAPLLERLGVDTTALEDQERAMEIAAIRALMIADQMGIARDRAAEMGQVGVFGVALTTVEDLEAGLQALEAQGYTAGERLETLTEAIAMFGRHAEEGGFVAAGAAEQLGAEVGTEVMDVIEDALADAFGGRRGYVEYEGVDAQVAADARAMDEAEDLREVRQRWLEEELRNAEDSEAAARAVQERYEAASDALVDEQHAREEAVREIQEMMPDEAGQLAIQEAVINAAVRAVQAAGVEDGGALDPAEMQQLARDAVRSAIARIEDEDARSELESQKDELIGQMEEVIQGLTDFAEMPQELITELGNVIPQLAQEEGRRIELHERDAVAGAQATVDYLQRIADEFEAAGTDIPSWLADALEESTQALEEAERNRRRLRMELRQARMAESDAAGRLAAEMEFVNDELRRAIDVGDQDRILELRRERIELEREMARTERDRAAAVGQMQAGADEVAQATAEIEASRRQLEETDKYDSAGNVTQDWAEAFMELRDAQRNLAEEEANRADAIARSGLDPRDELGSARADVRQAQRMVDVYEEGTTEWYEALSELNQSKQELAQAELQNAQLAREAQIDPRDDLAQSRADVQSARENVEAALPGTDEYWQAYSDLNQAKHDLARAELENAQAARRAQIDPRNELAIARAELQSARENMQAALPGTDEYWQAYQDVREGELQEAQLMQQRAAARRSAGIDPRAIIAQARADLRTTLEELRLALPGTREYWDLLGQVQQQQQALATAERERAQARRLAAVHPAATVDEARAHLQNAHEDLRAALPGEREYYDAQRRIVEQQRAVAEAQRARASAQRQAAVFPGAELAQARANLQDAEAELRAARRGEQEYYEALGRYREAQWALSEAAADRENVRRMLALDITDDVVVAEEELRQARDRLNRLRAAGAPRELLDEQRMAIREQENAAEMAAFRRRMTDSQHANDMGRMSHRAYMSFLNEEAERLRSIADRTRQQQEMLMEVERALEAAGRQMEAQWNIGDINIPTPFEVRRMLEAQTAGLSMGQVAQTQVINNETSVEINGADLVEVKQMLRQLLGPQATERSTVGAGRRI